MCALLLTLSAIAGGCGAARTGVTRTTSVPPTARPVAQDATQDELLERYNAFARGVKSVDSTVELKATSGTKYSGVIQEYHEVKAFLLAARPWNIRMIGQAPVIGTTVFDMASDGQTFEVSIPSKNKFIVGPVALEKQSSKPIENLRPQHLVDALLWPEIRKEETVLFEEYDDDAARDYVLTVLRGGYKTEILRRIWFDRGDLRVSRLEEFGPKGILLSDVRFSDWQPLSGATAANGTPSAAPTAQTPDASGTPTEFPRTIRLDRPHDEYRLDLAVTKIALNGPTDAARFKLEQPAGSELVRVGDEDKTPSEDKKP
jgi:hypothetical protein